MLRLVVRRDLVFERGRHEDVDVEREQLLVGDRLGAGEAGHGLVLGHPGEQRRHVEALGVVDAALPVGGRDDLRAMGVHQLGADRADVAEALHGHRRALELEAEVPGRLAGDDHHAASGGLAPAERAAHLDRLAGDDGGRGVADVHRVGVHEPRHDLRVGVDVGRRHVLLRSDDVDDLGGVAAGEGLEFALRHRGGVADDSALAAAERHLGHGALPGHPGRQRRDFVERDAGVVADAALGRAERDVVLHAVAGEDLDLAVVALDRDRTR